MDRNTEECKKKKNILIGFSGSVATIKDELLITKFLKEDYNVKTIYSKSSIQFSTILQNSSNFSKSIESVSENNYSLKNIQIFTLKEQNQETGLIHFTKAKNFFLIFLKNRIKNKSFECSMLF